MKYFLKLSALYIQLLIIAVIGLASCKNQEKSGDLVDKEEKVEKHIPQNLYLMIRVSKDAKTGDLEVLTIENEVIEKSGNPLPMPPNNNPDQETFRCEILDESNKVLFSSEQSTSFTYGENKNEAIVKYNVPLPSGAHRAAISYARANGVWEQIVNEKIE